MDPITKSTVNFILKLLMKLLIIIPVALFSLVRYIWMRSRIRKLHGECQEWNIQQRNIKVVDGFSSELPMLKGETQLIQSSQAAVKQALLPSPQVGATISTLSGTIVTGGKKDSRNKAVGALVATATKQNMATIVLHTNNYELTEMLLSSSFAHKTHVVGKDYNPFIGRTSSEIGRILFEAIPERYGVKHAARELIYVACEIIFAQGKVPNPANLAATPLLDLDRIINKAVAKGYINPQDGDHLIRRYHSAEIEIRQLQNFCEDLGVQLRRMGDDSGNNCNLTSAINNGDIIAINIGSNTNDLAINLAVSGIRQLLDLDYAFNIILDDIDLAKYKQLQELTLHNRPGFVLSHDDLFASVGGDEKLFTTVVGAVSKVAIFPLSSGLTCSQWSKYFGEYERRELKKSFNRGTQGMLGMTSSEGSQVETRREARVPPEALAQLRGTQVCLYDGNSSDIMFADIFQEVVQ